MAKFKIIETQKLSNEKFIITAEIISGTISNGDFVLLPINNELKELQINSAYKDSSDRFKLDIIIQKNDSENVYNTSLNGTEISTMKPIRGLDIQLAASYGIGVKWWAGILLLAIIALIIGLFDI